MVKLPALGSCPGLPSCNDETLCPDHRDIMRWQEALVCEVAQWKSAADVNGLHEKDLRKRLEVAELQLQEAQRDLSSLCHKIGEVTQDECSCEGSGPNDPKCCLACRIYHRLNGTVMK